MTPGQYVTVAKDAVILIVLGIILFLVYRAGKDHVGAADLKGLQTQIAATAKITSDWKDQANESTAHLSGDLAAIRAASSAPVQHSWVLDSPTCKASTSVLPAPASQPAASPAAGGGVQPIDGSDAEGHRRDSVVAAFKAQWETALAQCRAENAAWPK